jgi:hypothetical protein
MPEKKHNHSRRAIFLVMVLWIFLPFIAYSQEPKHETLSDGVEHWYYAKQEKNQFSKLLENIINAVVNNPPFGKSVAFLVGVSRYEYLSPQLPFVKNDLELLREFLLKKGGFDEVFVAADHAANAGLVLDYMSNNRMKLQKEDRLLFYYSGHGADMGSTTGYIQFSKAKPGELDINNYLGINECVQWSKRLKDVKHILFIYDCCVSGLAFTHKSGAADSKGEILSTLSGNGSRTVITAGTADERTFGVDNHSVFTKAFLDALNTSQNINGFMTMNEIFAKIERRVKDFAGQYEKKITPRRWELEEDKYRGTFLFVDSSAKGIELPPEYKEPLKVKLTPMGEFVNAVGIIRLTSYVSGEVYIDGQKSGDIEKGNVLKFYDISAEKPHRLEIRTGEKIYAFEVAVEKGETTSVRVDADESVTPPTSPPKKTESASTKPVQPQVQKPKYQLRKEPITVPDDEVQSKFKLNDKWRPLEYIQNDFKDNGNDTITDHATGLMWQKSGSDKFLTYENVKPYIDELNHKKFANHSDWRLPTVDELKLLLMQEKQSNSLYINPIFDEKQRWCWTSDQRTLGGAWYVDFNVGLVYWYDVGYYVRAVRSLSQ